jgi:aspartate 1-decarboxylase
MHEADILPYEQVQVLNMNNGARFTTYAIAGRRESGEIGLNGPATRLASKGDTIIILAYNHVTDNEAETFTPKLVYVDARNRITSIKDQVKALPH